MSQDKNDTSLREFLGVKPNPSRRYSQQFKRMVVEEYEQGFLNAKQLQHKYDIGGNSSLFRWLKKFGKLTYPNHFTKGRPMKDPEKRRIKELESQLKKKEAELAFFQHLIKVAERELKIEIVKKSDTKQSESMHKKKRSAQ